MDERKEDEDGDPLAGIRPCRPSQRKTQSFSQPLTRTPPNGSSGRKHSLDGATDAALNIFVNSNNLSVSPVADGGRSLSYPNYVYFPSSGCPSPGCPSPGRSFHHYQHPGDLPSPNPRLPPSFPHGGGSGSFASRNPSDGGSGSVMSIERAMCEYGGGPGTLPEFMGNGGGSGIFRVPIRAAMHPARPPALEVRPHPLRETQYGSFMRTIACTDSQIWAGQESGLRFWNFSEMFGVGACTKKGDEESAPFRESAKTSPSLCMIVDMASRLIWSGHKDGKVRSWKISSEDVSYTSSVGDDESGKKGGDCSGGGGNHFREGLSWQAHRTPVLSLVISSYGDIWSGSEGGGLKVWPWESIEKSLSLTADERHMAALLVERSYIDLRSNCTVNGVCLLPSSDVKHLLADNGRCKVWSGSSQSFALWDARKRELLKVFGIDGQIDPRMDMSPQQDQHVEDEMKIKFVSSTKKEKSQVSFFQRSRNALMGAADAVRRVAQKGTFGEDNRRTEALAVTADGMIWSGCNTGAMIQWDGNGTRLHDVQHHSHSVKSICSFGTRLWVGYVSGTFQVMDLEGNLLGSWVAHSSPVIKIAVGGLYIFTLANHGGIRGWSLTSPGPVDNILRTELSKKELSYTKQEHLKILCGTWNVGQARASSDSLILWLSSAASEVGLVVVGLQEVEMGAGFLAMAAAKETVGLEGSANGQWWLDTIGKTLDEGTSFERVGSRQLAGLLICAWARKSIRPNIGDVDAAAVACGFGRAIGNKGSVGLRMRVYDRIICFANCHFAAHLEAVSRRNADFNHIYRTMSFTRPYQGLHPASGGASSAVQVKNAGNAVASQSDDGKPDLSEADMVVFLGDFNYRLHSITYDEARDMVSQRCFDWLREKDQLRAEMRAGKVFQGMREGLIRFPPTYKFERHVLGLGGYDSGEKKRIPAWCDRILYRDSRSVSVAECSLECPVVSCITMYEACMDVTDSDHKPVRCIFDVEIARVDESIRRKEFGEVMKSNEQIKSLLEECCNIPETIVSTNNIILQNSEPSILRITNKCEKYEASFNITCKGQYAIKDGGESSELYAKGSFGFPNWLRVTPASGIMKACQTMEVSLHHDEYYTQEAFVDGFPNNCWCEDTRDKEVILLVNIRGSYSTETRTHHIHVRRCHTTQKASGKAKGNPSNRVQSNHLHRADFADFDSNTADLAEDLCKIRGN